MSSAEGLVIPNQGIPKTLGILNVIFGVILILYGFCVLGSTLVFPTLMQFAEKAAKDVQAKEAARKQAELKSLDDRLASAKTDEEKKSIEAEKANVSSLPAAPQVDISTLR